MCQILRELIAENSSGRFPVGQDVSGVVEEVGAGVTHVKTGDDVVGAIIFQPPFYILYSELIYNLLIKYGKICTTCYKWLT